MMWRGLLFVITLDVVFAFPEKPKARSLSNEIANDEVQKSEWDPGTGGNAAADKVLTHVYQKAEKQCDYRTDEDCSERLCYAHANRMALIAAVSYIVGTALPKFSRKAEMYDKAIDSGLKTCWDEAVAAQNTDFDAFMTCLGKETKPKEKCPPDMQRFDERRCEYFCAEDCRYGFANADTCKQYCN